MPFIFTGTHANKSNFLAPAFLTTPFALLALRMVFPFAVLFLSLLPFTFAFGAGTVGVSARVTGGRLSGACRCCSGPGHLAPFEGWQRTRGDASGGVEPYDIGCRWRGEGGSICRWSAFPLGPFHLGYFMRPFRTFGGTCLQRRFHYTFAFISAPLPSFPFY